LAIRSHLYRVSYFCPGTDPSYSKISVTTSPLRTTLPPPASKFHPASLLSRVPLESSPRLALSHSISAAPLPKSYLHPLRAAPKSISARRRGEVKASRAAGDQTQGGRADQQGCGVVEVRELRCGRAAARARTTSDGGSQVYILWSVVGSDGFSPSEPARFPGRSRHSPPLQLLPHRSAASASCRDREDGCPL